MAMSTKRVEPQERTSPATDAPASQTDVEYVGVVSRDANGEPAQAAGFKLLLPEGASDDDKRAAWNLDGEMPPESRIEYYKPWLRV